MTAHLSDFDKARQRVRRAANNDHIRPLINRTIQDSERFQVSNPDLIVEQLQIADLLDNALAGNQAQRAIAVSLAQLLPVALALSKRTMDNAERSKLQAHQAKWIDNRDDAVISTDNLLQRILSAAGAAFFRLRA